MDRKEYFRKYREQHRDQINRNQRKRRRAAKSKLEGIFFVNGNQYHPYERYRLFNEMIEKLHKICKRPDLPNPLFLKISCWYDDPNFRAEAIPTKGIKEGSCIAVFGGDLKWVGITTFDKVKRFRVGRNALFEGHFEAPPEAFDWFKV